MALTSPMARTSPDVSSSNVLIQAGAPAVIEGKRRARTCLSRCPQQENIFLSHASVIRGAIRSVSSSSEHSSSDRFGLVLFVLVFLVRRSVLVARFLPRVAGWEADVC